MSPLLISSDTEKEAMFALTLAWLPLAGDSGARLLSGEPRA